MKSRSGEKIKLTSIDELLGVVNEESAMEIDISKIHAFKDHPFKVLDDEKMTDLVESVKAKGVLTPVLLRPDGEEGYEMISGHRRMYAAVRAGLETIPAIVRELSDDDAPDELKRSEGDNPTIGIVLCSDTDDDIARYSVMHGNEQLFASKYKLYLPTKEELKAEIETQKAMFYLQQQDNEDRNKNYTFNIE